jgi:hypothetical protein
MDKIETRDFNFAWRIFIARPPRGRQQQEEQKKNFLFISISYSQSQNSTQRVIKKANDCFFPPRHFVKIKTFDKALLAFWMKSAISGQCCVSLAHLVGAWEEIDRRLLYKAFF